MHAPRHAAPRGFSLTEILVSIAVIGILSAIAIPSISHISETSKVEVANTIVTTMNRAVTGYRQCGSEITINANADASADEVSVMALLTTRDAGVTGTPFLQGPWPSTGSSDTSTYRARWNGRFFEVIPAKSDGIGLFIKL